MYPKLLRFGWLVVSFVLAGTCVRAQTCDLTLSGHLHDEHDREVLAYSTVFWLEGQRGVEANADGYYELTDLCPGPQTFRFSHLGCDPREVKLTLRKDTSHTVYLHHHGNFTETVTVSATAVQSYDPRLDERSGGSVTEVLERINGVSSLRTGTAAAKPVYDGLFGNRLSVQNNGIAQSGQQWGADHAPEIDPWVAAYVRVVEGVAAFRYGGSTLGPTVLIEPATLSQRTQPSAKAVYGYRSNGRIHSLQARITDTAAIAYRLSGSVKYGGDRRAPDYFLRNTGQREANLAVQLAKFIDRRWTLRTYYSLFNAEIGVLRGSHVGNITDLNEAIGRDRPFLTEEEFSYSIASPRQRVLHHLLKMEVNYRASDQTKYALRYGGQLNDRREYDVRRGSDDRAALSLLQQSHFVEADIHHTFSRQQYIEGGIQGEYVVNVNQPGTGILPLIPDYNGQRLSSYLTYRRRASRYRYHAGLRFDQQYYEAITISRDLPRRIERFDERFTAVGAGAGAGLTVTEELDGELEVIYRGRPPQINELYSQGLHQGVSGIEEGDRNLDTERSLKARLNLRYADRRGRYTLLGGVFVQRVAGFINLEPQAELGQTIRGAFPVFRYRGVDAELWGAKLGVLASLGAIEVDSRLAWVDGRNVADGRTLVYLPPFNWRTSLSYGAAGPFRLYGGYTYTARRGDIGPEQDLLAPPDAYGLVHLGASYTKDFGQQAMTLNLTADNVLNVRYRDYLDRQRYFADSPGRSLNFRLSYAW